MESDDEPIRPLSCLLLHPAGNDRYSELWRRLKLGQSFTEPLPNDKELALPKRFIALVSFDGDNVDFVCIGSRGASVATGTSRLLITQPIWLRALPIFEIFDLKETEDDPLPQQLFITTVVSGSEAVAAIRRILERRPEESESILSLIDFVTDTGLTYSDASTRSYLLERDALVDALDFFGFNRNELRSRLLPPREVERGFFSNIKVSRVLEDFAITHDQSSLPGWDIERKHLVGTVTASRGHETLEIVNINRTELEKITGCDLIYYSPNNHGFVMVQYKMLRSTKGNRESYQIDSKFDAEVSRMASLALRCTAKPSTPDEFRLASNPFFFKFCEGNAGDLNEFTPLSGFYAPLELIRIADQSGHLNGPRGGRAIRRESLVRVLSHTQFVGLMLGGLVGSCGGDTEWMQELIQSSLSKSRSVLFATERNSKRKNHLVM